MTPSPWFWIVAGSNGAGKSTHAKSILTVPIIDPDNPIPGELLSPVASGRETLRWIRRQIDTGESFGIETTLSGTGYVQTAARLKDDGWNIGLIYVGLESAELAIERVRARKQRGGHTVPEADIRRRYTRSLENLPVVLDTASLAYVFDNSSDIGGIRMLLRIRFDQTEFKADPLPLWLRSALPGRI